MKQIISFFLASGLSFLLFILMNALINSEVGAIDSPAGPVISIDVVIPETKLENKDYKKIKPPEFKKAMKEPTKSRPSKPVKSKPMRVAMAPGTVSLTKDVSLLNLGDDFLPRQDDGNGDSELQPRVRIEPQYPRRPAMDGIEGFVTLSFDINEQGRPVNIQVIEAKPKGKFETSARQALRRWKYEPKKIDGTPVPVLNHSVTLEFKLEEV